MTRFPEWGDSRYLRLRLAGVVRLADALNQLHVLLPVLDESKHYWQGPDEVDKLLRSGRGLARKPPGRGPDHPPLPCSHVPADSRSAWHAWRSSETRSRAAIEPADDEEALQPEEKRIPLNAQRHEAVHEVLLDLGARVVIDLGCGPGQFLGPL